MNKITQKESAQGLALGLLMLIISRAKNSNLSASDSIFLLFKEIDFLVDRCWKLSSSFPNIPSNSGENPPILKNINLSKFEMATILKWICVEAENPKSIINKILESLGSENGFCPFFDENKKCSIYAVRPISCRFHHCLESGVCGRSSSQDLYSVDEIKCLGKIFKTYFYNNSKPTGLSDNKKWIESDMLSEIRSAFKSEVALENMIINSEAGEA